MNFFFKEIKRVVNFCEYSKKNHSSAEAMSANFIFSKIIFIRLLTRAIAMKRERKRNLDDSYEAFHNFFASIFAACNHGHLL
jgi:hypothetical protein